MLLTDLIRSPPGPICAAQLIQSESYLAKDHSRGCSSSTRPLEHFVTDATGNISKSRSAMVESSPATPLQISDQCIIAKPDKLVALGLGQTADIQLQAI